MNATATDILRSYRSTRQVLKDPFAWLTLLTIAEAGNAGITATRLDRATNHRCPTPRTARIWTAAGLITMTREQRTPNNRPCIVYRATPKAFALLRIIEQTESHE